MLTTTTTKSDEVEACRARGFWFELVDPRAGDFYGPWLDATGGIEEYRHGHLARTGVALEVCRVERIGGPRVRVQNLERAQRLGAGR
jgi:hypothetical protein